METTVQGLLVGVFLLGLIVPMTGVAVAGDDYPVNVHRGTDIVVEASGQWGDPVYIANNDMNQTWASLTADETVQVTFQLTDRAVVNGDMLHLGGEDKYGDVTDDRDVTQYRIYAKDGPGDSWTLVKRFDGSVTADGDAEVRHDFSDEPFTATQIRLEIVEWTSGDVCSNCGAPIAEYQLIGHNVDEDFQVEGATPTTTTTTTTTAETTTTTEETTTTTLPSTTTTTTTTTTTEIAAAGGDEGGSAPWGVIGGAVVLLGGAGVVAHRQGVLPGGGAPGSSGSGTPSGPDTPAAGAAQESAGSPTGEGPSEMESMIETKSGAGSGADSPDPSSETTHGGEPETATASDESEMEQLMDTKTEDGAEAGSQAAEGEATSTSPESETAGRDEASDASDGLSQEAQELALIEADQADADSIDRLVASLESDTDDVRRVAADRLGAIAASDAELVEPAVAELKSLRLDTNPKVSQAATDALAELPPEYR